eukprot:PhF_6_TR30627/c0_g1_i1/m.45121
MLSTSVQPLWNYLLDPKHKACIMKAVQSDEERVASLGKAEVSSHSVTRRHHAVLFHTTKWMRVTITKIVRCGQVVVDMGRCTTIGGETLLELGITTEEAVDIIRNHTHFNGVVGQWWRSVTSLGEVHCLDHIRKRQYVWLISRFVDCLCFDVTPERRDAIVLLDWNLDSCGRRQIFVDTLAAMLYSLASTWVGSSNLEKMCLFLAHMHPVIFNVPPMSVIFPESSDPMDTSPTRPISTDFNLTLSSTISKSFRRQEPRPLANASHSTFASTFPKREIRAKTALSNHNDTDHSISPPLSNRSNSPRDEGPTYRDDKPKLGSTWKTGMLPKSSALRGMKSDQKRQQKVAPNVHTSQATVKHTPQELNKTYQSNAKRFTNPVRRTVLDRVNVVPNPQPLFPKLVPGMDIKKTKLNSKSIEKLNQVDDDALLEFGRREVFFVDDLAHNTPPVRAIIHSGSVRTELDLTTNSTVRDICRSAQVNEDEAHIVARVGADVVEIKKTLDLQNLVVRVAHKSHIGQFAMTTFTPLGQNPFLKVRVGQKDIRPSVRVFVKPMVKEIIQLPLTPSSEVQASEFPTLEEELLPSPISQHGGQEDEGSKFDGADEEHDDK